MKKYLVLSVLVFSVVFMVGFSSASAKAATDTSAILQQLQALMQQLQALQAQVQQQSSGAAPQSSGSSSVQPSPSNNNLSAPIAPQELSSGMVSDQVNALQSDLQGLGFFPSSIQPTNYFGPITEKSVINYQKAQGIPATGIADPQTINALNNQISSQSSITTPPSSVIKTITPPPITTTTQSLSLTINSISPSSGPIGTQITVSTALIPAGTYKIHFGVGGKYITYPMAGQNFNYTIPSGVSGCDFWTSSYTCTQPVQSVTPGSYPIYLTDSSGNQSNTVYFTVTSPASATATQSLPIITSFNTGGGDGGYLGQSIISDVNVYSGNALNFQWSGNNVSNYQLVYSCPASTTVVSNKIQACGQVVPEGLNTSDSAAFNNYSSLSQKITVDLYAFNSNKQYAAKTIVVTVSPFALGLAPENTALTANILDQLTNILNQLAQLLK